MAMHGRKCKKCGRDILRVSLERNFMSCPYCGKYIGMSARDRVDFLSDRNTFCEMYQNYLPLANEFPGYLEKLEKAKIISKEEEAVICGTCNILGHRCVIFSMEPHFMMGSLSKIVGEKITLSFEYATAKGLPILGICTSCGVRLQEGLGALMQMAKITVAVREHSDKGNLFIALLTDPTLGGVSASFAMSADIILAEPDSTIGLTGRKLVERFGGEKIPDNFQKAEQLLQCGCIDCIVERQEQKRTIANLLSIGN